MEQSKDSLLQSTVQLAVAFGRLHELASQVVAAHRDRDDTVSQEAFKRLQDHLEQIEQHYGLLRHADQELQARQRAQEPEVQGGSRGDIH